MTKHRSTSLAIATAVALSLPASASAKPVYDDGLVGASPQAQGTHADSTDLTIPLAGGTLVLLAAGAGLVRYRIRSVSAPGAIGGRPATV